MRKPYIEVTFANREVWAVPAHLIASNRATYYSDQSKRQGVDDVFAQEYKYTLSSDDELVDWFQNNMDWKDVVKEAKLLYVEPNEDTYDVMFANADLEVRRS
jgi:hypothetical protein